MYHVSANSGTTKWRQNPSLQHFSLYVYTTCCASTITMLIASMAIHGQTSFTLKWHQRGAEKVRQTDAKEQRLIYWLNKTLWPRANFLSAGRLFSSMPKPMIWLCKNPFSDYWSGSLPTFCGVPFYLECQIMSVLFLAWKGTRNVRKPTCAMQVKNCSLMKV